jgi:hypothetical protein
LLFLLIQPEDFTEFLQQRDDLNSEKINQIIEHLERIKQEVLSELEPAELQPEEQKLGDILKNYLQTIELAEFQQDSLDSLADFDFQSLTPAWQQIVAEIPLEQLSDRLGKLSYETLLTKTQAKKLFSESFLPQIQGVQDYISQQIDTIKQTAYEQTLQQLEATRKAIAIATYWIFAIAFSSVVTSAIAGFLATFYL